MRKRDGSPSHDGGAAQVALADYLQHGGYDRHLRKLRLALETQQTAMLSFSPCNFGLCGPNSCQNTQIAAGTLASPRTTRVRRAHCGVPLGQKKAPYGGAPEALARGANECSLAHSSRFRTLV